MTKFSIERFPPGFFDVTQDVAGELPLALIDAWTEGEQSPEMARRLLAKSVVTGAAVSTDTAGLTVMSRRYSLVEILALLDRPKEIVYGCGKAIGGEAIGVWAADNTGMLYRTADPRRLLSVLLETRDRIRRTCDVQIGLCVHTGAFFLLGGGLYGADADRVEQLAEASTRGGEVMITDAFLRALGDGHPFEIVERLDLRGADREWTVTDGPRAPDLQEAEGHYPYPYSREFFDALRRLRPPVAGEELHGLHARFAQTRTVVLIEHERDESEAREIAVLNNLALSAAMAKAGAELVHGTGGTEIKTVGNLAIFTFADTAAAFAFARAFRTLFQRHHVGVRIGIDRGEVLVFNLPRGGEEIAGLPVNLASKIAQDSGEFGRIYLTEAAARHAGVSGLERLTFRIAGVDVGVLAD